MSEIKAGSFVQIHRIVLQPYERSPQVPEETKKVPLELFVKGFLLHDATLEDVVRIRTITNRVEQGKLINVTPHHTHHFGEFVPEVIHLSQSIKSFMDEGD